MKAAIYIRVSSEAQAEGASLSEQKRQCQEYAENKGYEIAYHFKDVAPGTQLNKRPEFKRMLQEAENFDILIAWREDRLYRGFLNSGFIEVMRLVEAKKINIELAICISRIRAMAMSLSETTV